ncbi:MAG: DUF2288 family protein [Arenicella sp.]|nr:DUF2288 family protein [Arenicella sp.]
MNDSEQNPSEQSQTFQSMTEKLHSETALMHWVDLQTFFAKGMVLYVDESLDLIKTAVLFADDMADELAPQIESELITQPSNDQAREWYDKTIELWTVVVAPYILVQEQKI